MDIAQREASLGGDCELRPVDPPQLFSARMDMDQTVRHAFGHIEQIIALGGHLAEARTNGDDQVRLTQRPHDSGASANARLTAIMGMLVIKQVLDAETCYDGAIHLLGKCVQSRPVFIAPARPADHHDRAVCRIDHLGDFGGSAGGHFTARHRQSRCCGRVRDLGQHVFRQATTTGPGRPFMASEKARIIISGTRAGSRISNAALARPAKACP